MRKAGATIEIVCFGYTITGMNVTKPEDFWAGVPVKVFSVPW
jgi:hypothetical protein